MGHVRSDSITYAVFHTFEEERIWLVKTEGLRKVREERRWEPTNQREAGE